MPVRKQGIGDFQKELRERIYATGHRIADLVRETGIPYPRVCGYLNGYFGLTKQQMVDIVKKLNEWEGYESPKG